MVRAIANGWKRYKCCQAIDGRSERAARGEHLARTYERCTYALRTCALRTYALRTYALRTYALRTYDQSGCTARASRAPLVHLRPVSRCACRSASATASLSEAWRFRRNVSEGALAATQGVN